MELISSFAISCAAGIALELWSKSKQTVDKEIKLAFQSALKDWCPNSEIRSREKIVLKDEFLKIAFKPESFTQDYKCYGGYEKFYISFGKKLSQYPAAFNYVKTIQDSERYKSEIKIMNSLYSEVIDSNEKITEILEIVKISKSKEKTIHTPKLKPTIPVKKVLFTNYTKDSENFYLERKIDETFRVSLDSGNLWVYGFSGIGKTALINRNLIQKSLEYVNCDFSPIEINNSKDLFEEIILIISDNYKKIIKRSNNYIKDTCELLLLIDREEIVIVIDELAIIDSLLLSDITKDLIKLLNHYCNKSTNSCLKFVISTIEKPIINKLHLGKANEYFEFLHIDEWKNDLEKLLCLLLTPLQIEINQEKTKIIVENSNNSPRILKNILKKLHRNKNCDVNELKRMSELTYTEHNN